MSRTVRCKMICQGVTADQHTKGMSGVRFGAVYADGVTGTPGDENALFGQLTPFGTFVANMVNSAAEGFEVGAAYYFDIHRADQQ